MPKRIVVVGNGISGITAARYIRKGSDATITVVSSESPFFFARTALMYAFMGNIRDRDLKPYEDDFWAKNRIQLIQDYATRVDVDQHLVLLGGGRSLYYDSLILATGSHTANPGWTGDDLPGVQGFYSYQDLSLMRENTDGIRRAAVVGGGLTGVEVAEMLITQGVQVAFLVREAGYMDYALPCEESDMIARQIRSHGVELYLNTNLKAIHGGVNGRVKEVELDDGERLEVDFVALTTGVKPNTVLANNSEISAGKGIMVNRYFETSAPDVYAIGDCAEFEFPLPTGERIQQLWYSGRAQGRSVARIILGEKKEYDPGVFFNSAKFFELEYQTYGVVSPERTDQKQSVLATAQNPDRLVRIEYDRDTDAVTGFNVLGVRFRQDVCSYWIQSGASVHDVIQDIAAAHFDPEFSSTITQQLAEDLDRHSATV